MFYLIQIYKKNLFYLNSYWIEHFANDALFTEIITFLNKRLEIVFINQTKKLIRK